MSSEQDSNSVADGDTNGTVPVVGSYDCPHNSPDSRNLVVCIDGTANQFGLQNSHVVELYYRLTKGRTQLTYYNSGIGTHVKDPDAGPIIRWVQGIKYSWDMMVALSFKDSILHAYRWLSETFEEGDRIYLFGFSRGAYQVRVISGMISSVGLLHKGNIDQIPFAYELYLAMNNDHSQGGEHPHTDPSTERKSSRKRNYKKEPHLSEKMVCDQFKNTLSHQDVSVHFVGAWDTVSAVGVVRRPSLPETTSGMKHVCFFRHGLSLDENRVKMLPEYGNGGAGPRLHDTHMKEVWFTGSHSDIGGGNTENIKLDHFGPALRWMLREAEAHGLRVVPFQGAWRPAEINPSMKWYWRILEYLPIRRLSYGGKHPKDDTERWSFHRCKGRQIQPGQLIHGSVIAYMKKHSDYTPAASLPSDIQLRWEDLRNNAIEHTGMIEDEAYAMAAEHLSSLQGSESVGDAEKPYGAQEGLPEGAKRLQEFVSDPHPGRRESVVDCPWAAKTLFDALSRIGNISDSDVQAETAKALCQVLAVFSSVPADSRRYANSQLRKWLSQVKGWKTDPSCQKILRVFGNGPLLDPLGDHKSCVNAVAYSPDGKSIVSASADNTIRVWEALSGKPLGEPLRGHTSFVLSVAFAPDDSDDSRPLIVSGSKDEKIRIWNMETRRTEVGPLDGHDDSVLAVAFSPDRQRILSSSRDQTIRIWDIKTKTSGEPLRGHTGAVCCAVFSPDGRRIVSGATDGSIRMWVVDSQAPCVATSKMPVPLKQHKDFVRSVAYSSDGKSVVSASWDGTIAIWDIDDSTNSDSPALRLRKKLDKHTSAVNCVAFSSNSELIVSGSRDKTVRLWDAQTGDPIGEALRGHTDDVRSAAFSPDGMRIVSGSVDGTLLIWEVEGRSSGVES